MNATPAIRLDRAAAVLTQAGRPADAAVYADWAKRARAGGTRLDWFYGTWAESAELAVRHLKIPAGSLL